MAEMFINAKGVLVALLLSIGLPCLVKLYIIVLWLKAVFLYAL